MSGGAEPAAPLHIDVGLGTLVVGGAAVTQLAALSVPWSYRPLFEQYAPGGLADADFLHALAWEESGLQPAVVSKPNTNGTRDYGLMQINESNFGRLGLTPQTALDPATSVRAAAKLLAGVTARARNHADLASIYNAGQGRTGGAKLDTSGTYVNQFYVEQVLLRLWLLRLARFAPIQRKAVA